MAMHSTVSAFDPALDDLSKVGRLANVHPGQRTPRLHYYFAANKVTDPGQKASILLAVCGTPTYKLLHSLFPDNKFDSIS